MCIAPNCFAQLSGNTWPGLSPPETPTSMTASPSRMRNAPYDDVGLGFIVAGGRYLVLGPDLEGGASETDR